MNVSRGRAAIARASSVWLGTRFGFATIAVGTGLLAFWVRWDFAVDEHPPTNFLISDMAIYAQQAQRIFGPREAWDTFTPPGYPAFLALVGDLKRLGMIQALLGALTTVLTTSIARTLHRSPWTPLVAGLMCAFYFPLVFYAGFALTETLFAFLLLTFLWVAIRASAGRNRILAFCAGIILTAAITVRPSLLTFLPLLGWFAWRQAKSKILPWVLAGAMISLLPIALHTSKLLGRVAMVSSNGGVNFYLAHSDCRFVVSRAGGRVIGVSTHYTFTHHTRQCMIDPPLIDEPYLYRAGIEAIWHEPRHLLHTFKAFGEGLGLAPYRIHPHQPYWPGSSEHEEKLNHFSQAYLWTLLLPALLYWKFRRRRVFESRATRIAQELSWLLLASVAISMYVFNGDPRVRVSSDPIAIALAAAAYVALVRASASRRDTPVERSRG